MHSESGHCSRTFNVKGALYHCAEAIVNNAIKIQCHEETVDNVRAKIVKQKIKREAAIIHQKKHANKETAVQGEETGSETSVRRPKDSGRNKEIISLVRRTSVTSNLLVRHSHHLSNK